MIIYDRATVKLLWGIPPEIEYGRWNGTFNDGVTSWRRLVATRITQGTLNTTRILVVGCGIGLMVEGLRAEGFSRAWGIGLNDYFRSLWDQATCPTMTADTGDPTIGGYYIDPTTKAQTPITYGNQWPCEVSTTALRPFLGQYDIRTMTTTNVGTLTGLSGAQRSFDLIITEDVMTAYGNTELEAIYAACDARLGGGGQVRHLVSLGSDLTPWGGSPLRTLAEWTATLGGRTNHQFEDIAGVAQALAPPAKLR